MGGMVATLTVIRHQEMWKVGDPPTHNCSASASTLHIHPDTQSDAVCLIACAGRDLHGATMMAIAECDED